MALLVVYACWHEAAVRLRAWCRSANNNGDLQQLTASWPRHVDNHEVVIHA